jgi:hypothetical protein
VFVSSAIYASVDSVTNRSHFSANRLICHALRINRRWIYLVKKQRSFMRPVLEAWVARSNHSLGPKVGYFVIAVTQFRQNSVRMLA